MGNLFFIYFGSINNIDKWEHSIMRLIFKLLTPFFRFFGYMFKTSDKNPDIK